MPEVGEIIPPFEAMLAMGEIFRFPQDLQKPFSVIVVYRKNECVPCKTQLEYLRDAHSQVIERDAQILAISYPPPEETARVAVELALPYSILCDPEAKVLKLMGAINIERLKTLGAINSGLIYPTIFIVDRKGTILFRLVTKKTATRQEFAQVFSALEKLKKIL